MSKRFRIGIDIGGTNSDAVLVDPDNRIIAHAKSPTTFQIEEGFQNVLNLILSHEAALGGEIESIFLGTTHATNALLQQRDLFKVGVIRIAGQKPDSLPSCYAWPTSIRKAIYADMVTVDGGFECDGNEISTFNQGQVKEAIARLMDHGAESLAVVGVFSPLNSLQEIEVARIAKELAPELPISLSHNLGGIGFIERENSTVLNASLKKVMANGFRRLEAVTRNMGLMCPLRITQNNGSIIDLARAIEYPVLTISAGPTNSFIGGAKLMGLRDAIVVDIGGTSTDVGVVRKGYPRRCLHNSKIGGVSLNFSMPDVLSIALGGGSYVKLGDEVEIGPESSALKIRQESRAFGGSALTLTDVALALGHLDIPEADSARVGIAETDCRRVMQEALARIDDLVEKVGVDESELPIVVIGGGASLLPKGSQSRYLVPNHAGVANAYGAALAEIAATVDTVASLENRTEVLQKLHAEAIEKAVELGADPEDVRIVDRQVVPYNYVPKQMARVIITASGRQKNSN